MNFDVFNHLRDLIATTIKEGLPEPQASLLLGILLGIKSNLPAGFGEALRTTGTIHVIVASGYNISVLINTLGRLLFFVPIKIRFLLTIAFVIFFVLLVGPQAPIIRAAIMGTIALWGTVLGRQNDAMRAFLLTVAIMIIFNPSWVGELSFQLSFLATLGLIVLFPILDHFTPDKLTFLREDFLTTLSAQIMVWPLLAYTFGQISLISLLVNTLVLWTIPIITYLGLVATILSLVIKDITFLIMVPVDLFLRYFIWIVTGLGSLKFGVFDVSSFSTPALAFYYLILWAGIWFIYQTSRKA